MIEPELFNQIIDRVIEMANKRDGLLALDIRQFVWPYYEGTRQWNVSNLKTLEFEDKRLTWAEFMNYKLDATNYFVDPSWSK